MCPVDAANPDLHIDHEAPTWSWSHYPQVKGNVKYPPTPKQRTSDSDVPAPKDFLFINKHSAKLGHDADELFNITSHVSRFHRKWLKDERQKKLRSSIGPSLSQLSTQNSSAHSSQVRDHVTAPSVPSSHTRKLCPTSPPAHTLSSTPTGVQSSGVRLRRLTRSRYGDLPDQEICSCGAKECRSRIETSKGLGQPLLTYKGNADPFAAAALCIGADESEAISCASHFLVFAAWPQKANSVFRARLGDYNNSHIDLKNSLACEAELHAVIASGYSVKAASAPNSSALLARSLSHKVRSIELLRKSLLGGDSPPSLLTLVRLLISLDFHNGDFAAARVHLRGIRTLSQRDATATRNLRELLLISDVWTSMALLAKPDIDPAEYDPGSLAIQTWYPLFTHEQKLELSRPQKNTVVMKLLGPVLHRLLQEAEELIHSKAIIDMEGNGAAIAKTVLWTSRRGSAITGGLMIQYTEETQQAYGGSDADDGLAHLFRAATSLSLILHMNIRWMDLLINYDFSKTFPAIEPVLRRCSKHIPSSPPAVQELFAWLCFICAVGDDIFAARGSLDFSGWAAWSFRNTCYEMELADPKLAKSILLSIAYEEDIMDEFLNKVLSCYNTKPREPLLPFSGWKRILNHYVPD